MDSLIEFVQQDLSCCIPACVNAPCIEYVAISALALRTSAGAPPCGSSTLLSYTEANLTSCLKSLNLCAQHEAIPLNTLDLRTQHQPRARSTEHCLKTLVNEHAAHTVSLKGPDVELAAQAVCAPQHSSKRPALVV